MAIVAMLFTTAIRISKQGAQNQEAFEMARGAMRLLERDLSRAFTNRDHGDVYSFYGTPIGFTYVGMVRLDEDTDAYNLARVTYVIYHDVANSFAGAVSQYESTSGAQVPTYALLRYVEPGIDNLDSYQVPWTSTASLDGNFPTLDDLVQQTVTSAACPDATCDEVVARTTRRELWIRMLAGGDLEVPNAWDTLAVFVDRGLRPEDFFVTENVRYLQVADVPCGTDVDALNVLLESVEPPDFSFGGNFFAANGDTCSRVYGDALLTPVFNAFDPNFPREALPSPNSGPQPFFTYWDMGVITQGTASESDDQVTPLAFTFWNDNRNLIGDGIDNDGDGRIDTGGDPLLGGADIDWDEVYGANVGSPLDARLPLAVTADFTLFFKSPYPGAPDFNQRFTQRIDLPTGYRRTVKNTAPAP